MHFKWNYEAPTPEQEKAAKELKQMDLDASSKLLDKYDNPTIKNQTNIIVATREEIMKALIEKAGSMVENSKDIIDIKEE